MLNLRTIQARLALGFALGPIILAIVGWIAYSNTLSLNEGNRLSEDTAGEERNKAYKEDRKKRVAEANKNGDPYKVYPVTLDNAEDATLKLDSETKKEPKSASQLLNEDDDDSVTDTDDTFPHGFDPAKLEGIHIMQDLVTLSPKAVKDTVKSN